MFRALGFALGLLTAMICHADRVTLVADGGHLSHAPIIGWDSTQKLILTVSLIDGTAVGKVAGEITHPYGDGPFTFTANADVIADASFAAYANVVAFSVSVIPESVTAENTTLFAAKPDMSGDRPGSDLRVDRQNGYANYPHRILWELSDVRDFEENRLWDVTLRTRPILFFTDLMWSFNILIPEMHNAVQSVHVTEINRVPIWPTWPLYRGDSYFQWFPMIEYISDIPVTFEVRLHGGSRHVFTVDHSYGPIVLSIPSRIEYWSDYN